MKYQDYIDRISALLEKYAVNDHAKTKLALLIAEKSTGPNHLYEDMGFNKREEMQKLMKENYPKLAEKRPKDTRWKKFLYENIGERPPACKDCPDQDICFNDEI